VQVNKEISCSLFLWDALPLFREELYAARSLLSRQIIEIAQRKVNRESGIAIV